MTHTHRKDAETGPWGCAGNVAFRQICRCGAERRVCHCHQCERQGTNISRWEMPACTYCQLRHPVDQSCQPASYVREA
jgi:hypothetical protein